MPIISLAVVLSLSTLLPPEDGPPAPGWSRISLANGIQAAVLPVAGAESQSFFTFLPLGLLADEPGCAQFSHLLEHMLIRTTDPDGLFADGLRVNGETTALSLRLETIGPPARWREALSRHARWLAAGEFDADRLEIEKRRIAAEEAATTATAYTGKWALAAWNQVVAHGRERANVHADVAGATAAQLRDYMIRRLPIGPDVHVVAVGPIPLDDLRPALLELLGGLKEHVVEPVADSHWDGEPKELQASWDLDGCHYMEWYRLPDRGGADRVAAAILARLLNAALSADPTLTRQGIRASATAELVTPVGRCLLITAGCHDRAGVETARDALARLLADPLRPPPGAADLQTFVGYFDDQLANLPDFDLLRRAWAGLSGAELIEAQIALTQFSHRLATGLLGDAGLAAAHAELSADLIAEVAGLALTTANRSTLVLAPAE